MVNFSELKIHFNVIEFFQAVKNVYKVFVKFVKLNGK